MYISDRIAAVEPAGRRGRSGKLATAGSDSGGAADRGQGAVRVVYRHHQPGEGGFLAQVDPDRRLAAYHGGEVLALREAPDAEGNDSGDPGPDADSPQGAPGVRLYLGRADGAERDADVPAQGAELS